MIIRISDPQRQPIFSGPIEEAAGDGAVAVLLDHGETEAVDAVEDVKDALGGDGARDGEDDVGAAVLCAPEDGAGVGAGSEDVGRGGAAGQRAKEYASVGGRDLFSKAAQLWAFLTSQLWFWGSWRRLADRDPGWLNGSSCLALRY